MRLKSSLVVLCALGCWLVPAAAQDKNQDKNKKDKPAEKRETIAKPMTDKQRRQQQERLRKELETPFKKWLEQDVGYIISDEERKAFKTLATRFLIPAIGTAGSRNKRTEGPAPLSATPRIPRSPARLCRVGSSGHNGAR